VSTAPGDHAACLRTVSIQNSSCDTNKWFIVMPSPDKYTESLRTSNLLHRRSTKTRITDKRRDLEDQRSRSQGHVTRLAGVGLLADKSRTNRPIETPNLVGRLPTTGAIMRTSFKVKVRPTNAETRSASYLPNGKAASNLVHRRNTKTRISDKRRDLQGQGRKVT